MSNYKLSEDAARDQLDKFFDYYDVDLDIIPEKQVEAVNASIDRIVRGIRKGKLEIVEGENLKIIQHVKDETTLEYGELSGRTKVAMGKKSDTDYNGRIYALCGSLTGIGEAGILKLKGADLSLCECIGALFLQV